MDNASQISIITSSLCNKLGLSKLNTNSTIVGINQISSEIKYEAKIKIQSSDGRFADNILVSVMSKITGKLPSISFNHSFLNIPKDIMLADPSYNVSGEIDLLLGADIYWKVIKNNSITLGEGMPCLQLTELGWIIGGGLSLGGTRDKCCLSICDTTHITLESLNENISKFWEVENYTNTKTFLSPSER